MKNEKTINSKSFLLQILFLFSTSLISLKTLKKVNTHDIRISGSELFSQNDLAENLSLELLEQIINFVNIWYEQGFEYIKALWLENVLFLKQELHSTDLKNRVIGKFLGIDDLGQMIIKDKSNNSLNISSGTFIPINQ